MTLKEKALEIQTMLDQCVPNPTISLHYQDAYTLLIATLLAARCTDKCVNKVTPHLFARAKTPHEMVQLTPEEIRNLIKPCGLSPTKSRAIWALSKQLIEEFGGQVPNDFAALESLPGVGHKTASVVMAQFFGQPAFPVDTHVHRLAKAWKLSSGKSVKQTEEDLKRLFPQTHWHRIHLQMVAYGRLHPKER